MSELMEHQVLALRKLTNGTILWGGVGSGKTRVAVEYYKLHEAPKDVYVITTAKKRNDFDWQQQFYELGIGPREGPTTPPGTKKSISSRKYQSSGNADSDGALGTGTPAGHSLGGVSGSTPTRLHPGRGKDVSGLVDHSGNTAYPDGSENQGGQSLGGVSAHARGTRDLPDSEFTGDGRHESRDTQRSAEDGLRRVSDATTHGRTGGEGQESEAGGPILGEAGSYPYVFTVDSWNNLAKYADVAGAFFIFDEQRLVGSGDWTRKFLRIAKRNHWILLSATPGDTWMDYVPVFIANNFYKNRTEFKRRHVVYNTFTKFPKVDRYIDVGRLARLRAQLLVEMPYVRHTRRRPVQVPLPYDKEALDLVLTKRWHVYEERPLRDVAEMFAVARRIVNSDPSRLEMVKELWKNHPKLIVFYNFNYELESLRSLRDYSALPILGTTSTSTNSELQPPKRSLTDSKPDTEPSKKRTIGDGSMPLASGSTRTRGGDEWTTKNNYSSSRLKNVDEWDAKKLRTSNSSSAHIPKHSETRSTKTTSVAGEHGLAERIGEETEWTPTNTESLLLSSGRTSETTPRNHLTACSTSGLVSTSERPSSMRSTGLPQVEHGDPKGFETTVSIAEWNGQKHQSVPTTDRWLYLVQYTAGAEGWNCTETDAMIFHSRTYSWKVYEQAHGRIDRLNTPFTDLWYYNFTSDSWIDKAIERSLRSKENFNEAKYKRLFKG